MKTRIADIECFNEACPSHTLSEEEFSKLCGDSFNAPGPTKERWSRKKKDDASRFRAKHIMVDNHIDPPDWVCCACGKSGAEYTPKHHYNGPSYPYYNASLGRQFESKSQEQKYAKDNGFVVKDYRSKNRAVKNKY